MIQDFWQNYDNVPQTLNNLGPLTSMVTAFPWELTRLSANYLTKRPAGFLGTLMMLPSGLYVLMPIIALLGTLMGLGALAAQACARLAHGRRMRTGPACRARVMRARYAWRVGWLRRRIRSVTASTTGWMVMCNLLCSFARRRGVADERLGMKAAIAMPEHRTCLRATECNE
jgi:hypothetical protein